MPDPVPVPDAPVPAGDDVALTDLEVITRYSLALRTASAERAEVIRVLRDDLAWLTGGGPVERAAPAPGPGTRSRPTTPRSRRP